MDGSPKYVYKRRGFQGTDIVIMKPMPHVDSVMTPFPYTIEASRSVQEARAVMESQGVRHLPVTSEGRLVGVLSDRDLKLAFAVLGNSASEEPLHVGDVCNLEAYIVEYDTPLDQVMFHMTERRIGSTLVTRNGKLVGILTTTDVCRHYGELLKMAYPDA
jgi:CBS domain-containing protein